MNRNALLACLGALAVSLLSAAQAASAQRSGQLTENGIWIPDRVEELKGGKMGPFVRLADGAILTVGETESYVSRDEGATWQAYPLFADPSKYSVRPERALVRTSRNVVILAFANDRERANWNWNKEISDSPGAKLPTYAMRSLDGGKTWVDVQKLHDDWTGAIRDIIETKDGNVVFTTMTMRHDPGRHAVVTYTSKDQGRSWTRSNIIDRGGVGHHAGVTEATVVQLRSGALWMLMRTNWGKFWEARSDDEGLTWKSVRPTVIDASSAPGLVKRLASGRLVLVWNRVFPEGRTEYPLRGGDGQWSEVAASNHREELSIAFSNDDGQTWTKPFVVARITEKMKGRRLAGGGSDISYPYLFEAKPGEIWLTTWRGELRAKLRERDFVD